MSEKGFFTPAQDGGKRKHWVDFLRGIAILLVFWDHLVPSNQITTVLIVQMHIPIFFALSGYLFNERDGKVGAYFKNLFRTVILPWFLLSLVWLKPFLALIRRTPGKIPGYFDDFFSGTILWYIPCMILAETIFFFLLKFIKSEKWRYIAMLGATVLGWGVGTLGLKLGLLQENNAPFGLRLLALLPLALSVQIFLLFGFCFRNREEQIRAHYSSPVFPVLMAILYLLFAEVFCLVFPGDRLDVHQIHYPSYLLLGGMVFLFLMFAFLVAPKLQRFPTWILFAGRNTLLFYIGHYWVRSAVGIVQNRLHISLSDSFWGGLLFFGIVCISLSLFALFFNRFLPFAVGKRRSPKAK